MENLRKHFPFHSGNGKTMTGGRSVFHVKVDHNFFSEAEECRDGLVEFINEQMKLNEAGTRLTDSFTSSLKVTSYESLSSDCGMVLKKIFGADIMEFSQMKEIELILNKLRAENIEEEEGKGSSNDQALCRCILMFLKLQLIYHKQCTKVISTFVRNITNGQDKLGIIQEVFGPNYLNVLLPKDPAFSSDEHSKNDEADSPLMLIKESQHQQRAPFSLFGRRASSEEPRSAFYIPVTNETAGQSEQSNIYQNSSRPLSAVEKPIGGLRPVGETDKGVCWSGGKDPLTNGQLASEEELNSVINLLSGGGCSLSIQPIPESHVSKIPQPTGHHFKMMQLPLPQPPPLPPSPHIFGTMKSNSEDDQKMSKMHAHRRSEGSLDLTGVGTVGGQNTWPHQNQNQTHHQHRASLPAGPLSSQQPTQEQPNFQGPNSAVDHHFFSDVTLPVHPNQMAMFGGNLLSNPNWTFPDSKLNKTWPVPNFNTGGSDPMNSSWSGLQDSSDLSDDSSSGEQFFAVGLDLVHAMDSKDSSSDEDGERTEVHLPSKPRSMENLDCRSTDTWPPKHPWTQTELLLDSSELESHNQAVSGVTSHPLQVQWSDSMQNPNVWHSGAVPNPAAAVAAVPQNLGQQSFGMLQ